MKFINLESGCKNKINNSRYRYYDQRKSVWLNDEQTKKFRKLVDLIANDLGGILKAFEYIGLSGSLQDSLYKNSITTDTATKILNAYKKHKLNFKKT